MQIKFNTFKDGGSWNNGPEQNFKWLLGFRANVTSHPFFSFQIETTEKPKETLPTPLFGNCRIPWHLMGMSSSNIDGAQQQVASSTAVA